MTLDEIFMLLSDRKILRRSDKPQTQKVPTAVGLADRDGTVRGRAADGTALKLRAGGKSKARMAMEAEKAEAQPKKRRRRRRRGN